jgi:DNA polymerase-3 subunit epsilon
MHPGQRNSLDALCKRYGVDNAGRDLHGALLDARILADVYLAMSGGQAALGLEAGPAAGTLAASVMPAAFAAVRIPVIRADEDERAAHERQLEVIDRASDGRTVFRAGSAGGR